MADRIVEHYERSARDWDADRNSNVDPWNDKPWHDRFVAALPAGTTVLDLGCGSGSPAAKYMAERGLQLTGVDSSPTIISLCRERLPIMNGWQETCGRYNSSSLLGALGTLGGADCEVRLSKTLRFEQRIKHFVPPDITHAQVIAQEPEFQLPRS